MSAAVSESEAEHLRQIVEKQPCCLMRVATNGVFLAVNEAALGLLGASELAHVLDTSIAGHVAAEHMDGWREFAERVWTNGAASIECELVDAAGGRRTVLMQGVALHDHPDGTPSALIAARDVSAARSLERILQTDQTPRATTEQLDAQLADALAEQRRLAALLDESRLEHQRCVALWEESLAEKQRLTAVIEARAREREQLEAGFATDRARLQQTLAEEQQLAVLEKERDGRLALSALEARFAETSGELSRRDEQLAAIQARLAQAVDEQQQLAAAIAQQESERARLQQALADREQLAAERQSEDTQALVSDLRAKLEAASAERAQFEDTIGALEIDCERASADRLEAQARLASLIDEHEQARRLHEQALADLVARSESERETERQRLAEERQAEQQRLETERQRLDTAHAAERARLERTLTETQQLALQQREQEAETLLGGLQAQLAAQLAAAADERMRLQQAIEELNADRARTTAECAALRAELATALDARDQTASARDAEQQATIADLERRLADALAEQGRVTTLVASDVQAQLAGALAKEKRLETLLARSETEQMRMVAEHAADRMRSERAVGEAILERNQAMKTLADIRVEVQHLAENARTLESLASAGRLAQVLSGELDAIMAGIDKQATYLLGLSSLESAYRHEVEALRAAALRAASLARQFVRLNDSTIGTATAAKSEETR